MEASSMNKLSSALCKMLITMSCAAAYAESEVLAFANYPEDEHCQQQESVIDSMDAIFDHDIYEIQQESSSLRLQVKSPLGKIWVSFDESRGSFSMLETETYDDLASIEVNTASMETGRGMVGMMLRSEGFLGVKNLPSMHFVGNGFEWFGENHAVMKGYLIIKDATRLVSFFI